MAVFLIVLSAAGEDHLPTVWRVCFGIGILLPVTVFFFRMRMMTTVLCVSPWFLTCSIESLTARLGSGKARSSVSALCTSPISSASYRCAQDGCRTGSCSNATGGR